MDAAQSHPELLRRWNLLVSRSAERGWGVWIVSSTRSIDTQRFWYALYKMVPSQWPNIVADPDRDAGVTPWGWRGRGSFHMVQLDGYSHALDINWSGAYTHEMHALANTCGLRFPEPTENWHTQAFDAYSNGFYPVEEDDMTPSQLGLIRDPDRPDVDEWGMFLMETVPGPNGEPATYKWYRYDVAVTFIHQELKMARLG